MSDSLDRDIPDGARVRRTIRTVVEAYDALTRSTTIATVASRTDAAPEEVAAQLDRLEREGLVYLVPTDEGDDKEVRVP